MAEECKECRERTVGKYCSARCKAKAKSKRQWKRNGVTRRSWDNERDEHEAIMDDVEASLF